jgi:hypothetical protein
VNKEGISHGSCAKLGLLEIPLEKTIDGKSIVTECMQYEPITPEMLDIPPPTTGTEIKTYINWLEDKLADTKYGEVGLIFNVKEAKVCMVDKIEKIKYKLT